MTAGAIYRSVKALVAVRAFVAAAARLRRLSQVTRSRMRIMAADASAPSAELGVIGVHALVAAGAGLFGAASHVVWSVAAHASGVRGHFRRGQRVNLGVARATG